MMIPIDVDSFITATRLAPERVELQDDEGIHLGIVPSRSVTLMDGILGNLHNNVVVQAAHRGLGLLGLGASKAASSRRLLGLLRRKRAPLGASAPGGRARSRAKRLQVGELGLRGGTLVLGLGIRAECHRDRARCSEEGVGTSAPARPAPRGWP